MGKGNLCTWKEERAVVVVERYLENREESHSTTCVAWHGVYHTVTEIIYVLHTKPLSVTSLILGQSLN